MLDGVFTQNANRERTEERSGSTLARDVTENQREAAVAVGKKIVKVAAKLARGDVRSGEVETGNFASAPRKQLALDFARSVEFAEKALFVAAGFFVKTGIFECNRDECGESRKQALVFRSESARLGRFQVEHSDETIPQEQRNHEFGADAVRGITVKVARLLL